jgi:hypothetical protein
VKATRDHVEQAANAGSVICLTDLIGAAEQ